MNKRGNKIFYFKCQLIDLKRPLKILNKDLIQDYKWLTADDCQTELGNQVWKKIHNGLFVENMDDLLLDIVQRRLMEKKMELTSS